MLIINNTNLTYEVIGQIIDNLIKQFDADTIYYGKIELLKVRAYKKEYVIQIRYLKRYTEWTFFDKK